MSDSNNMSDIGDLAGQRILVTGASGVVGGAVARALQARGAQVVTLQRRPAPEGLVGVQGDVTDPRDVARAIGDTVSAIVHAAARVSIVGPWSEFERANVEGTRVLAQAARAHGVARLVFVSSPSVAHAGRSLVGAGASPADPEHARSHYARSKALAERVALAAGDDHLAVVAVRPHLVWGPGDTQLTQRIIDRARAGRLVFIGSGAALIDTTYITNAADAIIAALVRAAEADVRGRAFVVSNGQPRTVAEMLTRIAGAAGLPGPQRHVPLPVARTAGAILERVWRARGRTDDPPVTAFLAEQLATAHWFDQRQTRAALRWTPRVGLDAGFDLLAEHLRRGSTDPGAR